MADNPTAVEAAIDQLIAITEADERPEATDYLDPATTEGQGINPPPDPEGEPRGSVLMSPAKASTISSKQGVELWS